MENFKFDLPTAEGSPKGGDLAAKLLISEEREKELDDTIDTAFKIERAKEGDKGSLTDVFQYCLAEAKTNGEVVYLMLQVGSYVRAVNDNQGRLAAMQRLADKLVGR